MPLSAKQLLVLSTKFTTWTDEESLEWLKEKGHEMCIRTYYLILSKIESSVKDRMFEICKNFTATHINRLEKLRFVEAELWRNYHSKKIIVKMVKTEIEGIDENGNEYTKKTSEAKEFEVELEVLEKAKILKDITELQLYHSAYEEATKAVQEDSIKAIAEEEGISLKAIGL